MSTLVAFSVSPLGVEGVEGVDGSVSAAVAAAIRVVRESGLPNETNAMFTNVEGDWDDVMAVVKAATMAVAAVSPRVSVVIKIDHRPGVEGALSSKVARIEEALARDPVESRIGAT